MAVEKITKIMLLLVLLSALPVLAQEEMPQRETAPPGSVVIEGAGTEDVISEFRINGQLYMIRITPTKGVPYYLVDSDGDGQLETRWNDLASDLLIPAWVLKRW
jgi:hypothetical protein